MENPGKFTLRKVQPLFSSQENPPHDSLNYWIEQFLSLAIQDVRSSGVAKKIELHLHRFQEFTLDRYGHERMSTCLRRDVLSWQNHLIDRKLAPATINNHLASLSAFTTWIMSHDRRLFPSGDPAKGISELGLPPLEPRTLSEAQVRSVKNVCDRLERFHTLKGRQWSKSELETRIKAKGRPLRDRAIVYVLLSTGLRREELVRLNIEQVQPCEPQALRQAKKARILNVKGKGKTERTVFLSNDARLALADYIELERVKDAGDDIAALFLSATCVSARRSEGRLSPQTINNILIQIGRWHDSELTQAERQISPLRPHDLRHTFAFQLAKATGADAYELERRLGHRSQRYIQRYTNPPEEVAATYVEHF
ncbi:MAG: tyrosine-type recombinase/integrase [Candidatus Obscuribacterales bacterium]|jgi:site-specific recombinase XerD|nr:tyrosine-type recombinase/integrase [Candidatus Obscuribacterales bacterium]